MADPRRMIPILRRATLIVSALMLLWIVSRFRTYTLSEDVALLPPRFGPGERLLLDKRPRAPHVGDAWLVRTDSGTLALGIVQIVTGESMGLAFGRKYR